MALRFNFKTHVSFFGIKMKLATRLAGPVFLQVTHYNAFAIC